MIVNRRVDSINERSNTKRSHDEAQIVKNVVLLFGALAITESVARKQLGDRTDLNVICTAR
jgi:hypothetical protein